MMSSLSNQPPHPSLIKALTRALGKKVLVVLKRNLEVNGILRGFDQRMHLHLDNAVTTDARTMAIEALGTVVLRGDSVLLVNAEDLVEQREE